MDRRIGIGVMGVSAVAGMAIALDLFLEHGWPMPPMVPVFLLLMVAAPALAWFRQDVLAWTAAVLLLGGVALFGLSHGFFIWPGLATMLGMVLTVPSRRQPQVTV